MSNSAGPKITKDGLVLDFDVANIKSYNFYADPYASNVSLHLKMDGANNSTAFTDSSPNALAVTAVGDAKISTAQSRYGGSAAYFDGTGDYLNIVSSSYFNLPADFTVECWFNPSNGTNSQQVIAGKWTGTGNVAWTVVINPGLSQILLGTANSGNFVATLTFTATSTITTNTWHHLAVVRSGSTVLVFVNGVQAGAGQTSTSNLTASDSNALTIGQFQGINYFTGYIDELKITKGVARYTSAFTSPPIPSTCTDLTRSKNVGTLTGGVDYNFSNGGSLVFDGTNDYIYGSLSSSTWASNFTICAWFKHTDYGNLWEAIFSANTSSSYWGSPILTFNGTSSATRNQIGINNAGIAVDGIFLDLTANHLNKWIFCALSLSGSTITISAFQDGILSSTSGTLPYTLNRTSLGYYIGRHYDFITNQIFKGSIANIMIYNKALTSTEVYNNFVANRGRFGV